MRIHLDLERQEVAILTGMLAWYAATGKLHPDDQEALKSLTIKLSRYLNETREKQ